MLYQRGPSQRIAAPARAVQVHEPLAQAAGLEAQLHNPIVSTPSRGRCGAPAGPSDKPLKGWQRPAVFKRGGGLLRFTGPPKRLY